MNSLVKNVAKFVQILRLAGVRTSISETIDAIDVLSHVNLLDRNEVKIAMSACLAKSEEESRIFYEAFDRFFIPPADRRKYVNKKTEEIIQRKKEIIEDVSELKFKGEQIDIPNDLKEIYANLPDNEKQSIKNFLDKSFTYKDLKQGQKQLVESILKGKLNNIRQRQGGGDNSISDIFGEAPSEVGIIAGEIIDSVHHEEGLLHKNIGEIKEEDIPKVIKLIKLIAERLKRNINKRFKRTNKKSRLDIKKTIRSNLSTGGVMFRIKYKSHNRRKNRFIVLCDVSASMYRFSGFVLQFIMGMHLNTSTNNTYIFSEGVEHFNTSDFVNISNFEKQIKESTVWRKGTNINRVLYDMLHNRFITLNSSTIVLIVSDAKTLDADKAADNLKLIDSKVKRILWFNPIPEKDWEKIAGIDGLKKNCTMYDCSTIDRLTRACSLI